MRLELERILELQSDYSARNTPAMQERGRLIRTTAAKSLIDHEAVLAADIGLTTDDLLVQGRDGTGQKTRVPWLRFGSRTHSPSATQGFYVVYLFDAQGDAVFLSLNQGTTDFVNGDYVPKPSIELEARVIWARETLSDWLDRNGHGSAIELHAPGLGSGYERGNVAAIAYRRNEVPDDEILLNDARVYARGLGRLYAAQVKRPLPYETPEVEQAIALAEEAAGRPSRARGAGFRTDSAEIKLIETHAVNLARAYYKREGWQVKVLGKPFDLDLRRGAEHLTVEVKGTTSDGSKVVLTAGEVRHHDKAYPNNALVIVRHILLDRTTTPPTVSGGVLHEQRGWSIAVEDLQPISFSYTIPQEIYIAQVPSSNS
jgi:hypothetical protein